MAFRECRQSLAEPQRPKDACGFTVHLSMLVVCQFEKEGGLADRELDMTQFVKDG